MRGSKITSMTSAEMRAASAQGEDRSDWARVRREANADPVAADENRRVGELIARKRGRPVVGEPKEAISLRIPVSILERWKSTGPGWQTRMIERLSTK
ncbi:MAG: hypothetical protein GAK30_02158 [Paracidovorax wautersii]|uniref:BrnA antitoxin of type II toxin-antitoxin system n=1 Tax=Paracidovorax wautersii TaxID=1177982 RepID=A0A7V8FNJ4_9BURK|nr:MAG: hypothetical protein GAK30_02158 [Paracidovorax wautersii]